MVWLSWRLVRGQALVAGLVLAVFAAYVLSLGAAIRRPDAVPAAFASRFYAVDFVILLVPALLGLFWGAPMITREVESGTHRLVWNQSVTRGRWLLVRLGVVAAVAVLTAGTASLLVSWAAAPYDKAAGDRFSTLLFGTRNLVPAAYGLFAVALGVIAGLLVKRTLPAMALTAAIFAVVQGVQPNLIRPRLMPPEHAAVAVTAPVVRSLSFLGADPVIEGLRLPGGWVIDGTRPLTADGKPLAAERWTACVTGSFDGLPDCVAALDTHVDVAYQPAGRYWTFQLLESALFAGLAGLLALIGWWRIRLAVL
jgi:hypothetical protein